MDQSSDLHHIIPSPESSLEAYLLLEVARSNRQISLIRSNLAYAIVHRNSITLQLNRIMLEKAKEDAHQAGELISHVRLAIRQSGYSAAHEYSMKEPWPRSGQCFSCGFFRLSHHRIGKHASSSESVLDVVLD